MKGLFVDARMLFNSGIGTVIQNVLKRISGLNGGVVVLDEKSENWCRSNIPNWRIVICPTPIYSVSEQLRMPIQFSRATKCWVPHYNLPLFCGSGIVTTIHDVLHVVRPDMFPGFLKQAYARAMFKAAGIKSEAVACVSEFTAGEFMKLTGCPAAKIHIVYNGVDEDWFGVTRSTPVSKSYFVCVGNIKPHKNVRALVKAFIDISDQIDEDLVIVGQKKGFVVGESLDDLVGLSARVHFTGFVDDAELKQLVAGAKALVFPSLYEGFGLPPLEAMACGIPVIASNVTSIPEICGDAAIYFDPAVNGDLADKLLLMSEQIKGSERKGLILKGKKRAERFSWNNTSFKMLELFNA